jgi:hypothetical protein
LQNEEKKPTHREPTEPTTGELSMRTLICGIAAVMLGFIVSAQAQTVDFRNSSNSPHIYSSQGEYLGNLNNNRFDPNSVSNQFGAGSPFRSNGVNNRFSPNYMPGLTHGNDDD